MTHKEIPLSAIENLPDPRTEDDIIARLDAAEQAHILFSSDRVRDRYKVVLALRHNLFPVELKGVRVDAKGGEKTIGELANALPENTKQVTQYDMGEVFGVTPVRIDQIEDHGFRAARGIIHRPPSRHRPWR